MENKYKLRIAICDDVPADLAQIRIMTEQILQEADISHKISAYTCSMDLLQSIQNGDEFQLLLLDVMMEKMDGMELAQILRSQKNPVDIIFISNNREMALYGYEVSAVRYLEKPLNEQKLREALLYCCKGLQEKKEILLQTRQGQRRISVEDIHYVEAFERGTKFVLEEEVLECRFKFNETETMFPGSTFILCHRAYMVNAAKIRYIRKYEFEMNNGEVIPISRSRFQEIHKKFIDYITA